MDRRFDVVVIGGGPAGMMAAIFACQKGKSTIIIDHNEKLGKKLYITGKGRCNITNVSSIDNHMNNILRNPKFLYSALNYFSPNDVIDFFNTHGLNTTTERGNRAFPASNKSSDVIKTLTKTLDKLNCSVLLNTEVKNINKENDLFNIKCGNNMNYTANSVVVACGGVSYSLTGSDGTLWKIISKLGHKMIEPRPALTRIVVDEDFKGLEFLELKNVKLTAQVGGNTYSSTGEMAFANNMLIGPIALTISSLITRLDYYNSSCELDLKIGLTEKDLEEKLLREFSLSPSKKLFNYLKTIIPHSFVPTFTRKLALIDKNLADITKEERKLIIDGIKHFKFTILALDEIDRAIITSGGVDVREVNSKTMESKIVKNLYFAGEVLDVDALTGGYNLQIAWSTGALAGSSVN